MNPQTEKKSQHQKMVHCKSDTPDLIIHFGPTLKSYRLLYGINRTFAMHDQIITMAMRTAKNTFNAMVHNTKISRKWISRNGKKCHEIQEQLKKALQVFHEHITEMHHRELMATVEEAYFERDWQGVKRGLHAIQQHVRNHHWPKFEEAGLALVQEKIPSWVREWKKVNPRLPNTLLLARAAIFSAILAVEKEVHWFEQVTESWKRYITHHIGSRCTAFPPSRGGSPFFPKAMTEVFISKPVVIQRSV